MRAVVYDRYGPPAVLRLEEVERPAPAADEVLVQVHATTINRLDCHTREANRPAGLTISVISRLIFGLRRPRRRILGSEFAGVVESVGASVTELQAGDRVFGNSGLRFGAHAEYMCVPESRITHMPAGSSFADAAAVSDGVQNAMGCLRAANLKPGQRILVYGASGAIGTAAVQLARHFGLDVTAVTSTGHLELVASLGPDRVIDRNTEDFTRNGETYDSIFDAVGKNSFKRCKGSLKPGGTYLPTDGARNLFLALWTVRSKNRRVLFPAAPRTRKEDLLLVKDLMEKGEYRAIIDRTYAMDQVIEAARYVDTGKKVGNVVLTIRDPGHPQPNGPQM